MRCCICGTFKWDGFPLEAGHNIEILACFKRNAWRYGYGDLIVKFSVQFWSMDKIIGGFQSAVIYVGYSNVTRPDLELAKFQDACRYGHGELTVEFRV
jgi:hypothetical protein